MNLSARRCGICQAVKHEHDIEGETPWGDPVCSACCATFDQCRGCGGYLEPSRIAEQDNHDNPLCAECVKEHAEDRCDRCGHIIIDLDGAKLYDTLGCKQLICGRCRNPQPWHANRTRERRHPILQAADQFDQEAAKRLEREP